MTETDETAIRPGRVSIEIRPLWDPLRGRHVSGGEALVISATLTSAAECDRFADLYNAARAQLWPIEDEAAQDDAPAQDDAAPADGSP